MAAVLRAARSSLKAPWPVAMSPQLAVLSQRPPVGQGWVHEIKFDGYRFLAHVQKGRASLITRNGHDWTDKFTAIATGLQGLKASTAILDGEAVVLDAEGRSDFQALQAMLKDEKPATPSYYVFDLLYLNGEDLRPLPLIERKQRLEKLLNASRLGRNVHYSEHVDEDAAAMLRHACGMGLEGIISKRTDAPYVSRRDYSWLKSKCEQRQEFVIIGWTNPQGGRVAFGSLLLGYHDSQGRLVYAGRVGTGFDDDKLRRLLKSMQAIAVDEPPTDVDPPRREKKNAHWIKPKLVAEIRFTGWTRDNYLRHPVFIALRSDKPASQIVREQAVDLQSELTERARGLRNGQPLQGGNGAPKSRAHRRRR